MDTASIQDKSTAPLVTLASSLLSSFSSSEVVTESGRANCSEALTTVSSLSRLYLAGSKINAQLLAELVSAYTIKSTTTVYGSQSNVSNLYDVAAAAALLVDGVQLGMAFGELNVSLVTSNIQVSVVSELITSSKSKVLTTPATASQLAYGSIQPKLTLGPSGLSSCDFDGGYAHLSVLQWSVNPYAGSMAVKSPLLRLTSAVQATSAAVLNNGLISNEAQHGFKSFSLPGIPAYYVALQFSSKQDFNFSAISSNRTATTRGYANFTLPACGMYNGTAYVHCKGCNISSYTDFNVTYSCFDITQLCPSSSVRRYLVEQTYRSPGAPVGDLDGGNGQESQGVVDFDGEGGDRHGRLLGVTADGSVTSSLSYGVLIKSIAAEVSAVLTSNPFKLDLAHSTVVLTFVGCLSGFIIIMIYYLLRRDYNEKVYNSYVKSEADNVARKLLKDDIRNGGNGDLHASFQTQVKSLNRNIKSAKSFLTLVTSTFSRREDLYCRKKGISFLGVNFDFDDHVIDEFDSDYGGDDSAAGNGRAGGSNFRFDNIYSTDSCDKIDITAQNTLEVNNSACIKSSKDSQRVDAGKDLSAQSAQQFGTSAVVTEFLFKLFPGRSIFIKEKNAVDIVRANHKYFSMFASNATSLSRTIRFIDVVAAVLIQILGDTIFFEILYPTSSACPSMVDKVRPFYTADLSQLLMSCDNITLCSGRKCRLIFQCHPLCY